MIQHNSDLDFSFLSHSINMNNAKPASQEELDILEFIRHNPGLTKQEIAKHFIEFSQFQVLNKLMEFAARGQIKKINKLYYSEAN